VLLENLHLNISVRNRERGRTVGALIQKNGKWQKQFIGNLNEM